MRCSVSIARVHTADLEQVVALLRAQLHEHNIETPESELRDVTEAVISESRHGFLMLAHEHGRAVAVAYAASHLSAEHGGIVGWLEELYVAPEARARGIGSQLLAETISRAQGLGWRALELEVVAGHERVVSLYERHGFQRLERTRFTKLFTPHA